MTSKDLPLGKIYLISCISHILQSKIRTGTTWKATLQIIFGSRSSHSHSMSNTHKWNSKRIKVIRTTSIWRKRQHWRQGQITQRLLTRRWTTLQNLQGPQQMRTHNSLFKAVQCSTLIWCKAMGHSHKSYIRRQGHNLSRQCISLCFQHTYWIKQAIRNKEICKRTIQLSAFRKDYLLTFHSRRISSYSINCRAPYRLLSQ